MLNWNSTKISCQTIYTASIADTAEKNVRQAIEACTDKAVALLKNNIQDNSLYLLFEWNTNAASLTIVVTDADKKYDAPDAVCCRFSGVAAEFSQATTTQILAYTDLVKFWLHDYLTTCTAFFNYSLVAIFHSSNRNNTELL